MSIQTILNDLEMARRKNKVAVFTHGAFDVLHPGHLAFLEQAKTHGDLLVVGIHKDEHVRAYKGAGRPVFEIGDRLRMISALRVVDFAVICPDATAVSVIEILRPEIYVKDGQTDVHHSVEAAAVMAYGGHISVLPYNEGISTSDIVNRLLARTKYRAGGEQHI